MADAQARIVISARDDTAGALAKAKAGFAKLQGEASGIADSFVGLNAAITGALAGSGLALLFKNTVASLDALNDLKDATGASIENISALEDVAARTGTSFETVGSSLVKFNQALNAATPNSDVSRVLKSIGVDAEKLKQIDPAEALRQTAVALSKFADDGNKARAAQELFGKSLREVAPFLKDLATAGELNATVTTQQAQAAEDFANAMSRLGKNAEDTARSIVSGVLPLLNEIINSFADGAKEAKDYSTAIEFLRIPIEAIAITGANVAFVFKGVGREIGAIAAQLAALGRGDLQQFTAISDAVREDGIRARKELDDLEKRIMSAGRGQGDLYSGFAKTASSFGGGGSLPSLKVDDKPVKAVVSEYQKYIDKLIEAQVATLNLSAEEQARYDISIGKLGKLNALQKEQILITARGVDLLKNQQLVGPEIPLAELERRNEAAKDVANIIAQTTQGQINALTKQYGNLDEALKNGRITSQQYVDALDILDQRFADLSAPIQKASDELSEFTKQAQRNIQDAVGDSVLAALEGRFDSILDLWGNLIKKMVAQAIAADLNNALFGGSGGGGSGGASMLSTLFKNFGGFFADGGYLAPGKWGVAGENGPELIMAGSAGATVTPNVGGGSVNVTYNIQQIGSGVSRGEVVAGLAAVREQTRSEVVQMLARRGVA